MEEEWPDRASSAYRIVAKTARAVRERGKPFEILLKARQDGNEMFDFLYVGRKYHQFYIHLVAVDAKTFENICMDKPCTTNTDNLDALAILTNTYNDDDHAVEKIQSSITPSEERPVDLQLIQQNIRLNKAKEFIHDAASRKQYRVEDYPDNSLRKKIKQYLEKMIS